MRRTKILVLIYQGLYIPGPQEIIWDNSFQKLEGCTSPRNVVSFWHVSLPCCRNNFKSLLIPDFRKKTYVTLIFRREFLKDYTFADAHLLARVTSYYGEVITNMFFVLVLIFLEIWAFPSGRHVMIHGPLHGPLPPIYTEHMS